MPTSDDSLTVHQRHYRNHREQRLAYSRRKLLEKQALVRGAKRRPCVDCGVQYDPEVMDLDHVRGDKKGELARIAWSSSFTKLKEELDKCEVRCANCHRARHGYERWLKTAPPI